MNYDGVELVRLITKHHLILMQVHWLGCNIAKLKCVHGMSLTMYVRIIRAVVPAWRCTSRLKTYSSVRQDEILLRILLKP